MYEYADTYMQVYCTVLYGIVQYCTVGKYTRTNDQPLLKGLKLRLPSMWAYAAYLLCWTPPTTVVVCKRLSRFWCVGPDGTICNQGVNRVPFKYRVWSVLSVENRSGNCSRVGVGWLMQHPGWLRDNARQTLVISLTTSQRLAIDPSNALSPAWFKDLI